MKKKLKEITKIQSGFYFRTDGEGEIFYLQAKNFDDFGELKEILIPEIKYENIQKKHLLQEGDILFSAKGTRNFATVYQKEYGKCIASSTFFIIRILENKLIPEYLAILLNQGQHIPYFKSNFSGGGIQSISKSVLENYEIEIPPIVQQQKIIELYQTYLQQLEIYNQIKQKKDLLINKIILSS